MLPLTRLVMGNCSFSGSYATDITNCRAVADNSTAAACGAGVKVCQVVTTYSTYPTTASGTTYGCAPTSVGSLTVCTNTRDSIQ